MLIFKQLRINSADENAQYSLDMHRSALTNGWHAICETVAIHRLAAPRSPRRNSVYHPQERYRRGVAKRTAGHAHTIGQRPTRFPPIPSVTFARENALVATNSPGRG